MKGTAKYRIKQDLGETTMGKCKVKFQASPLGPSAVLFDADGHSINLINYPKGTKLSKTEKSRARKTLMRGCKELSRRPGVPDSYGRWSSGLGGLLDSPVPPWLAGAAALAGGVLVFNLVKTADPQAS